MRNAALVSALAILLSASVVPDAFAKPANPAEAKVESNMRMVGEYIDLGEYKMARETLEKGLADLKMAGSAVRPIAAEAHVKLGVVLILGR